MARSRKGGQSVGSSMKSLFSGIAMAGIVLVMLLFVTFMLREKSIEKFLSVNGYDNETVCDAVDGTPCAEIRDGFDIVIALEVLGLGLLSLVAIILVFVGYLLPVIQRTL